MGGSGSSSNTVKTNLLPDWATDVEVPKYLELMQAFADKEYEQYADPTYALQGAGFSWTDANGLKSVGSNSYELDGIKALAYRGRDGHNLLIKGETLLKDVIDGLKLNSNTKIGDAYLKKAEAIVKHFEEVTLPRLDQQMNLSNNYGSYGHHYLMAKEAEEVMAKLADLGMDTYFKNYLLEKTLQTDAVSAAPVYSEQEVINAELQIRAGELQREYIQGLLIDDWKKWAEMQTGIIRRLEVQGNSIRALLGAQSREVVPYYRPSTISQIAGLALVGIGLYGTATRGEKLAGSGSTSNANAQYSPSPMAIPASTNENTGWGG